ncbi:MAG: hypothetical protein AAF456_10890 [Planctomycetota bacterium]
MKELLLEEGQLRFGDKKKDGICGHLAFEIEYLRDKYEKEGPVIRFSPASRTAKVIKQLAGLFDTVRQYLQQDPKGDGSRFRKELEKRRRKQKDGDKALSGEVVLQDMTEREYFEKLRTTFKWIDAENIGEISSLLFFPLDHCFEEDVITLPFRSFIQKKRRENDCVKVARNLAKVRVRKEATQDQDEQATEDRFLLPRPDELEELESGKVHLFLGKGVECYEIAVYIAKNSVRFSGLHVHTSNVEAFIALYILGPNGNSPNPVNLHFIGGKTDNMHGCSEKNNFKLKRNALILDELEKARKAIKKIRKLSEALRNGEEGDEAGDNKLRVARERIVELCQSAHESLGTVEEKHSARQLFHTSIVSMYSADAKGFYYDGNSRDGDYNSIFERTQNCAIVLTSHQILEDRPGDVEDSPRFEWNMDLNDGTTEKRMIIVTDRWAETKEIPEDVEVLQLDEEDGLRSISREMIDETNAETRRTTDSTSRQT